MTNDVTQDVLPNCPINVEGVDDEPVEHNRRIFTGRAYLIIATLSGLYAIFHMPVLNGWSIRA